MNRGNVLLVGTESAGHRQNYASVLGRWFASCGYRVVVACGPDDAGCAASQTPVLGQLQRVANIVFQDLPPGTISTPRGFVSRLAELEVQYTPAWTLFVNGDECSHLLNNHAPRQSPNVRRAASFIYFAHEYAGDFRGLPFFRRFRKQVSWLRLRRQRRRYFNHGVWKELGLDLMLCLDENAVSRMRNPRIRHVPEIYRAWGIEIGAAEPRVAAGRHAYADFLARHPDKDVLVYYGGRFARRGYDQLLALASEQADTVFVSIGRDAPGEVLPEAATASRDRLSSEGRLFELDLPFLPENPLVDDLFQSARYVLLPYRNWFGLSGILVQAAAYGCPVLTPDVGYMGTTVRRYRTGMTFRHQDWADFRRQYAALRRGYHGFVEAVRTFARSFEEEAIHRALTAAFIG